MESSDDSCDSEIKIMKKQLTDFGMEEENLTKEEMVDLLKALNDSKTMAKEELYSHKTNNTTSTPAPKKPMKRKYLNVRDRRLPWSVLPSNITPAEKAQTLAVYIQLMSMNSYRQARQSSQFATWPPPLQIIEETARVQPLRSTRSGRSVPIYADFDDDSSDLDFIVTKTKKRKISDSDNSDCIYLNKTVSLKRRTIKEDHSRTIKEVKMIPLENVEASSSNTRKDIMVIED